MGTSGIGILRVRTRIQHKHFHPTRVMMFVALGLFAVSSLLAQLSKYMVVRGGFTFPEYYETPLTGRSQTNRLKGILKGSQGQYMSNDLVLVTVMSIEHYEFDGRTNLVALAPECVFNVVTHVASSTGRLEITGMGGALFVEGNEGFQCSMTNSSLIVSNRVRTVIHQGLLKTSKP